MAIIGWPVLVDVFDIEDEEFGRQMRNLDMGQEQESCVFGYLMGILLFGLIRPSDELIWASKCPRWRTSCSDGINFCQERY